MADSKKYDGSQWEHSLKKQTTASEIIVPPTTIYANGQPISTYTIKGNTVQNGTPTPSNPVAVNGVGKLTDNLFDINAATEGVFVRAGNTTAEKPLGNIENSTNYGASDYIAVSPSTAYTIQYGNNYTNVTGAGIVLYDSSKTPIYGIPLIRQAATYTFTTQADIAYIRFSCLRNDTIVMLNIGSSAMPYENYGEYKIPISTAQGTSNIYLSEPLYKIGDYADTINSDGTVTRRIKKINLGDKNYTITASGNFNSPLGDGVIVGNSQVAPALCTDFQVFSANVYASVAYSLCAAINTSSQISINKTGYEEMTAAEFKVAMNGKYLYYALATPTTETVAAPSIPTTDGANSISIDTTVQPSEFTATWTGWHDSSAKEYDGTDWQ